MKRQIIAVAITLGALNTSALAEVCPGTFVANGDFATGRILGSMPSGSVSSWSDLTATPQVVEDGCSNPGGIQMWGNLVVGESVKQQLPLGIQAGKKYRVSVCYRWLDNNPNLPQYVRFRLTVSGAAPGSYPPVAAYDVIGSTPNTSSTTWISYTFPDWTAPNNASWLTVNPENDSVANDGNFVSWGQIDDICITEVECEGISNPNFEIARVLGSMPSASVADWSLLTASPQVVEDGCTGKGSIQMWGNLAVGESIQQQLPGSGFQAGKSYRVSVCYRWLDNNPNLPQYVRFRLAASSAAPAAYPPLGGYDLIGSTPNTSSTNWITYTFPIWTAPNNETWITVNPENDSAQNDGNFVSWGQIDAICVEEVSCGVIANGGFTNARVVGSMPDASVANWSLITASPQVVDDGCQTAGALQMWGNLTVGESAKQLLPGSGIQAGKKYRVTVCYRWLDNNPNLPQYVRFRLTAAGAVPTAYPPTASYDLIGSTPNTSSTNWITYTFPTWTAPNNASYLTVNPENNLAVNDGNFVSWGQIDDICIEEVSETVSAENPFANPLGLRQNWPNPFSGLTTIRFELARGDRVSLRVFDVAGRLVRTLANGSVMPAGGQHATWDGRNEAGLQVGAGIYFYRLDAGALTETKRMIVLR